MKNWNQLLTLMNFNFFKKDQNPKLDILKSNLFKILIRVHKQIKIGLNHF